MRLVRVVRCQYGKTDARPGTVRSAEVCVDVNLFVHCWRVNAKDMPTAIGARRAVLHAGRDD